MKRQTKTRLWPKMSTIIHQRTQNTSNPITEVIIYVWRYVRYMEYHFVIPVIKRQYKTIIFETLYSTESTQIIFQKVSQNNSMIRSVQTCKLLQVGSTVFFPNKGKTNLVWFINDSPDINRQLKCKPYPMPKICGILLKLDGFKYDVSME